MSALDSLNPSDANAMSDYDIVTADVQNNHKGRDLGVKEAIKTYDKWVKGGGKVFKTDKVRILYTALLKKGVEFHCINGGNANDLIDAVNSFLQSLIGQFPVAVTYYDNPAINELLKHATVHAHFEKIDEGVDKTYAAVFILRNR